MAVVLPFIVRRKGWSQDEQAEFVRATALLRSAGLPVVVEDGLSDEGDPWTIFLREDTGDVIAHIARIDGLIMAVSAARQDVVSGPSFRAVMNRIIRHQPLVLPTTRPGDTVFMHPAAALIAFVATALAWSRHEESDLHRSERSPGEDDTLGHELPQSQAGSGSFLREALLSKAEAAGLSLDLTSASVASRLVLAISMAAIVLADHFVRPAPGDAVVIAAASTETERRPDDELQQAGLSLFAAGPSSDLSEATPFAEPNGDFRIGAELRDLQAAIAETPAERTSSPLEATAAAEASVPIAGAENTGDHAIEGLIELNPRRLLSTDAPDMDEASGKEVAAIVATKVPEIEGPATADPGAIASPAANGSASEAQHVKISADAGDFLTLVFDFKSPMTSGAMALNHLYLTESDLSHFSSLNGVIVDDSASFHLTANEGVTSSDVVSAEIAIEDPTPTSSATGYQLIGDILAFAFDQGHLLSPSAAELRGLSSALAANPFLPAIDRILVIDLPDLLADAFRFTDSVIMMSRDLAHQLLPTADMQAQAEMGLPNGINLKLIGVIDLQSEGYSMV